jgi:hypothetical protein
MTFGQTSGPPASAKQVSYLLSLVERAGFSGFADARHPLGLTQRQAKGKFTGREASELIEQLLAAPGAEDTEEDAPPSFLRTDPAAERRHRAAEERQAAEHDRVVRGLPADVLANELIRRGWTVGEPE